MKIYNLYIIIISILTFISCKKENKNVIVQEIKTVKIDTLTSAKKNAENITQSTNEITEKKELNDCQKHWKLIDSLQKIKYTYFKENIFNNSITKSDLPEANKTFLLSLNEYLKSDRKTKYSKYAIEQDLLPIFNLDTNQIGIIGNQKYDFENKKQLVEINKDRKLLNLTNHFNGNDLKKMGKLIHYKSVFDSVFYSFDKKIFIYTDKRRISSKIENFGFYYDECLEYYHYTISKDSIKEDDKVLFGSKIPLELYFKNFPEIDSVLKNQYADGCYDCSFKYEPEKTFATLKGVKGLYFTYTDTFPVNNEFDYPSRALIMKINDSTTIDLWLEDVDLFGCSCL